jgi:hypothetical protein
LLFILPFWRKSFLPFLYCKLEEDCRPKIWFEKITRFLSDEMLFPQKWQMKIAAVSVPTVNLILSSAVCVILLCCEGWNLIVNLCDFSFAIKIHKGMPVLFLIFVYSTSTIYSLVNLLHLIVGLLCYGFGSTAEMCKKNLIWVVIRILVVVDCYPTWLVYTFLFYLWTAKTSMLSMLSCYFCFGDFIFEWWINNF